MISRKFDSHRWLMISVGAAIAALGTFAPSAKAADFSLNFDQGVNGGNLLTHSDGSLVTTQWADWGLTDITGVNNRTARSGGSAVFNIYNTDLAGGQDDDLETGAEWGTPSQGNVLIIQEENRSNRNFLRDNGVYRADDEARGGRVNFDFADEVLFNSFSLLDIDDNGRSIRVQGKDAGGNSILDINVDDLIDGLISTYGDDASQAQGQSVTIDGVTLTQVSNVRGDNSLFEFSFQDTYLSDIEFIYPGSGAIAGLEWSEGPRRVPEPSALGGLLMLGLVGTRKYLKRKQA